MNDAVERLTMFSAEDVDEWCEYTRDNNELHESEYDGEPFGEATVPGMMLIDQLPAMLDTLSDTDEVAILSGITAARFRDPVMLDETVKLRLERTDDGPKFTSFDFTIRTIDRDELSAHGVLTAVIR